MSGLAEYLAGENDGPGGTSMPGVKPKKPCLACGAPKMPGRGYRYCETCERAPRRPEHVPTPCSACGSRENKQRNKQLCDECKELREWRKQKRSKTRSIVLRHPCPRCGRKKSPGRGKQFCDACMAANREPARCLNCKTRPVRARRKRLCVECHQESRERNRVRENERARKLNQDERNRQNKRSYYQRLRHDPVKWAHALESQRLQRRLKAAREGREVRFRAPVDETPFDLPARPLALMLAHLAEASDLGTVCELASIGERAVSRWRTGAMETVTSTEADAVLTALDLLWWEVWREDTVRRPLFVVHVYSHQMKSQRGGPRVMRRVKQHRIPYGDQGPDHEKLAEIAARMSGEALAA